MDPIQTGNTLLIAVGQSVVTKNNRQELKATHIATSIVVVVYDTKSTLGGMVHMALPDSKMEDFPGKMPYKYVDLGLPRFIEELLNKGLSKSTARIRIVGGSQLFNFGGGGGNVLNIGLRNAVTARTILTREGLMVEKTETGGNKARSLLLDMKNGSVQVFHPGEAPRFI